VLLLLLCAPPEAGLAIALVSLAPQRARDGANGTADSATGQSPRHCLCMRAAHCCTHQHAARAARSSLLPWSPMLPAACSSPVASRAGLPLGRSSAAATTPAGELPGALHMSWGYAMRWACVWVESCRGSENEGLCAHKPSTLRAASGRVGWGSRMGPRSVHLFSLFLIAFCLTSLTLCTADFSADHPCTLPPIAETLVVPARLCDCPASPAPDGAQRPPRPCRPSVDGISF
jgi:hypothetical protein